MWGGSWGATAIINLLPLTQSFVLEGLEGVQAKLGKSCSSRADDLQQRCGFHLEVGWRRMSCCTPVELDGALPWTPPGCKQRKTIGRPSKNQVQSAATQHWNWMRKTIKCSNGQGFFFSLNTSAAFNYFEKTKTKLLFYIIFLWLIVTVKTPSS